MAKKKSTAKAADVKENAAVVAAGIPVSTPGGLSKFQAFTTDTVHRSVLKGAPYNPRYLPAKAKAKLRETLGAVGLVQPIVWNRRTGFIVGGHQRISQIDALEGHADYQLTVAVVDVDEKREKELNILLNNTDVTGEWDLEKLKGILDGEIELMNTGFDHAEFMKLFGEAPSQPKSEHQEQLSADMAKVKDAYAKLTEMGKSKDDTDFYNVVVFGSYNERSEFLKEFGFEDNRYIDGRTLVQILRQIRNGEKTELPLARKEGDGTGAAKDKPERAKKPA
ncbi:MAG: hypothetical protein WCH99_08795 [Verrucomicrobiota bacterium]